MTARRFQSKLAGIFVVVPLMAAAVGLLAACEYREGRPRIPAGYSRASWTNSLGMHFLPVPGQNFVKMSIWETRVRDFTAFVRATGHDATENYFYYEYPRWRSGSRSWRNPGFEQTENHPVVGVSWGDAMAFCHWLTEHEQELGIIRANQTYRLPTDREWSSAAYPVEPGILQTNSANYSPQLEIDPFDHTSPVGSFPANIHGFYDMAGNVWEFCMDPQGIHGNYRTIRGGCWQNWHSRFVGVQARGSTGPNVRIALYGFRVVLETKID